eukprot:CAMPEP_0205925644 /NCGR_PEP_ID=MMETSP1325-20131115/18641_1 /ASSEMBLY_ACC=CAM_ASM_000708 /TAXON_ID=236786 /ORGANISM="Florenciella sp., Strain RCC1007" /LENGTH=75 /DNA_ID=CAMNT_0053294207 /DNA_START=127 /DNA_END=351 /DNA_ORIENTATION=+
MTSPDCLLIARWARSSVGAVNDGYALKLTLGLDYRLIHQDIPLEIDHRRERLDATAVYLLGSGDEKVRVHRTRNE